ncbi:MAG: UPF0175 family protein [Anaerolineales bacterium]|nr:UPF0175 family protein [Anaerolineales bacterium]
MEISFSIPQNLFLTESPDEVAAKVQLYAALGMYQAGELSTGAACELADVDRYVFLVFSKRQGIILQTQIPEELEEEYKYLVE